MLKHWNMIRQEIIASQIITSLWLGLIIDTLFCSYVLKNEKADVYRLPYLASGGPGFG